MLAHELRARVHSSLMAFEEKWVRRCNQPLVLVYADGTEEDVGVADGVEFNTPMMAVYTWNVVWPRKEVIALRFDGTGRPMQCKADEVFVFTWSTGVDWSGTDEDNT